MTPDFGYYVDALDSSSAAHTFFGGAIVCIPVGSLLVVAFYLMREPLWFLLPARHRQALATQVDRPVRLEVRFAIVTTISVLLGAWTHILWDSFTHRDTWAFHKSAFLREPLLTIGPVTFKGYAVLQNLSTLIGAVVLALVYFWWLHKQPRGEPNRAGDRWRYFALFGAPLVSFTLGILLAIPAVTSPNGIFNGRAFVFKAAVYSMSALMALMVGFAVCYHVRRPRP